MVMQGLRSPVAMMGALCLLLVGCSREMMVTDNQAAQRATALAAHYGAAKAFTADMRIIAKPMEGDLLSFSVSLWSDSDGRLRMNGKKFNVHFLEGIIEPDNTFTAVLVREEAVVRGSLSDIAKAVAKGEAAGGATLSELSTISSVLRLGPLATASNWSYAKGEGKTLIGDIGDNRWVVDVKGQRVTHSTLKDQDGTPLFSLRFTHEKDFEHLIRAQGNHLSVADDDSTYLFRLQRFEAVPGISDTSMLLNVPGDWQQLSVQQFLDLLVAPE